MAEQLQKQTLVTGNGTDYPKRGDRVTIQYTGWLYQQGAPNNRGDKYVEPPGEVHPTQAPLLTCSRFDSSVGRRDFVTEIGVGRVIQGWKPEAPPGRSHGQLIFVGHIRLGSGSHGNVTGGEERSHDSRVSLVP